MGKEEKLNLVKHSHMWGLVTKGGNSLVSIPIFFIPIPHIGYKAPTIQPIHGRQAGAKFNPGLTK